MAVSTEEILKLIRGNGKSKVEVEVEGKEDEEMEDEEKPEIVRDGNVLTLTQWTKTKGNA